MASPSLSNPNLKGLWSCSHLKGGESFLKKAEGGLVLLVLTLSWSLGTFGPLIALYLLYLGGEVNQILGTTSLLVFAWPFVVTVKPWPAAARFWLKGSQWFAGGCSMSFEKRSPDDTSIPIMQCYHPHGIFTLGLILNSGVRTSAAEHAVGSDAWGRYVGSCGAVPFVGLAAEKLVQMPVFRHIMVLWTGNIESASKQHLVRKMKRGECFGLCPGGFHEANLFERGRERVYLGKRGFIAYALKYGYKVVPAYTFGESDTYFNAPGLEKFRLTCAEWGIPAILVTGPLLWLPFFALLPFGGGGLHTIHGQGRQFPKVDDPSKGTTLVTNIATTTTTPITTTHEHA